ncbi:hydroxyethylthiazole kinase [Eggerthellaceae bacterium zg-1084]|uniref:hydroxyethylthiazole kinase n=1 Tax=Berryella wangjianweii TaxID=2734634 RepID=UPI00155688DF|nr:hydroxyethylthiazole kinase [Berryella wangjianweii]NPD31389.1 hydroxyethylthiazole kinase [Berryella wangjianweii]NPD32304.1 hydroxyethylthiazole kinase [Eggerthellaceae bacterium zg-997]
MSEAPATLHARISQAAREVRATCPLAGSITNAVTVNLVANAQLAAGGSAAMVYLADEALALTQVGGAFYVNLGTLLPCHAQSIPAAARALRDLGRPLVLDPVGIGLGELRGQILDELRDAPPAIVRCNASEAIALARQWGLLEGDEAQGPRGVDAQDAVDDARAAAQAIARFIDGAVAVSGETDLVASADRVVEVEGGSPLMTKVTGMGCSLGGVAAVYAAVTDPFTAALAAAAHYKVAGTRAQRDCAGPASFQLAFVDALHAIGPDELAAEAVLRERGR